jgi:hypothetical protein
MLFLPFADLSKLESAVVPAFIFLMIPILGVYVLNKSIMGEIGCSTAILMLGTAFYLLFVLWKIEGQIYKNIAMFGIFSLTVGIPILQVVLDKYDDKVLEAEQISLCYQQIRMNPQNFLAAFRLARLLYNRNDKDVAIAIADHAIIHMNRGIFREEYREYEYWKQRQVGPPLTEIECAACNKIAPAGALICPHCLGSIHLDRARKFSVVHNKKLQKVITIYATLLIVLMAMPLVAQLNPVLSIALTIGLLAIAIWAVIYAFGLGLTEKA